MVAQYRCQNKRRLSQVRSQPAVDGQFLNGIDYLEVAEAPLTLIVHFVHNLPGQTNGFPRDVQLLEADNLRIVGGVRIQEIQVESVSAFANILTVQVNQVGDLSAYRLRLVDAEKPDKPPDGFDPQLAEISFYFQNQTISEFGCGAAEPLTIDLSPPPLIDYLAKDYASFRRLMLDRLAITMPKWRERSPADIGMMLVELLAYRADYLSYYQDAVATEAYLGTARKRVSIRRHARLLDYFLHDGCNARAWVALSVNAEYDGTTLPGAYDLQTLKTLSTTSRQAYLPSRQPDKRPQPTQFLTHAVSLSEPVLSREEDFQKAIANGAQVFEAMHDITLYACRNEMHFYTWSDDQCELPQGATTATLEDDPNQSLKQHLKADMVIILEEVYRWQGGQLVGPDLAHRQAVRLTDVVASRDPLTGTPLVQITWHEEDALSFALPVSHVQMNGYCQPLSVARGNVLLVDHGQTVPAWSWKQTPKQTAKELAEETTKKISDQPSQPEHQPPWQQQETKLNHNGTLLDEDKYNLVPDGGRYRPRLKRGMLTQRGQVCQQRGQWLPFDPNRSAKHNLTWQLRDVRPCLTLIEHQSYSQQTFTWIPQIDLLNSDRFARDFVVETEDDGRAYVRFGDNVLGKRPEVGSAFTVSYRIGNGTLGNVGAEAIHHICLRPGLPQGIFKGVSQPIRNPLPAVNGIDPESIEQVRQNAPQAFREPRRAVTDQDYETLVANYPGVRKAVVTRRWNGSWYTHCITVDRDDGKSIEEDNFQNDLKVYLVPFRMSGHDLTIEDPRFVPLDIALSVEVSRDQFRSAVKAALLQAFSNVDLPSGGQGFFHPDNYTFGQPVYLSKVVQQAMAVEGVKSVNVIRFQRWGYAPQGELDAGQIPMNRLEIARLDNNANAPEYGRLEFKMVGGL
jgi:hypothetical protein